MPKIDVDAIPPEPAGELPAGFEARAKGRRVRNLGRATGLTDFVANHTVVPPGMWSAQRHWHESEDELVVVLAGSGRLVDDAGAHPVAAGDVATFVKGDANAHHFVNDGAEPLVLVAVSLPERSTVHYPDIAMRWHPDYGTTADR